MNHPPEILNIDLPMVEGVRLARERGHVLQTNGDSFILAPALLAGFVPIACRDAGDFCAVIFPPNGGNKNVLWS